MGDHPGAHDESSRAIHERVCGEAEVNRQNTALEESLDPNGVEETYSKCGFYKPDDIYDGEISLGTKPGVPAEYEFSCLHEARLQAKDASLQEALIEVAKLKTCNNALQAAIIETRKHCYDAEEKVRKKSQDLTTANRAIIDNNAHINNLKLRNSDLEVTLGYTKEKLDKKHEELVSFKTKYGSLKTKYGGDLKQAMKLWDIYSGLGDDLFYQMTHLEVIVANESGRLFFEEQDLELKARAARYFPLGDTCKTMQAELYKLSKETNANDDLPEDEGTAYGEFRLPIEAPPTIDNIGESSSFLTSGIEQSTHTTSQETSAVEDYGSLDPTTPEVSILETNNRSFLSASAQSNSEEGRPDSASSNEPESELSMCEGSGADSIYGPKVEDSSTTESRGLRWLLGYNHNPEESFYPQYPQGGSMVDPSQEQVFREIVSEGSPKTEGLGLQSLLGFNAHPEDPFYPQLPQHDEDTDTESANMSVSARNKSLMPLMGYNPGSEELVDSQEPQSPSGTRGWPHSTYNKPAAGPDLAWLLGYNPEPEEAFYPQHSQHHDRDENSTSSAPIEQTQGQTSTTVPDVTPIFEMKPDNHTTATTTTDSASLAVDISFADTSKHFKEEVAVLAGRGDTASTASTELELQETSSKTRKAAPIFAAQAEDPSPVATKPAPEGPSVDITFGDTSHPFKAGAKVRMTRSQRREAAMKMQAEAVASEQKVDGRALDDEGGKYGRKESRQERRAAERKASKAGSKQSKRNIWRL